MDELLNDSGDLLKELADARHPSERWYARNNLAAFLREIETRPTPDGLRRAAHTLRRQITDQLDWSTDYCRAMSELCSRAEDIAEGIERAEG